MTGREHPRVRRWIARGGLGLVAAAVRWLICHHRSPSVRYWRRGAGEQRLAGELSVRTSGEGPSATILLHGLTASGDFFGSRYDQLAHDGQLVIPDLLGFGRSLDENRSDHSLEAHMRALDLMAHELHLDGLQLTVAGHSFGALLALHWSARRADVARVVCFSTPLYVDVAEADERIAAMGAVERLFGRQGPAARALCAWMCRHRAIAQWVAVAVEPQWPVAVTRMAVHHSWASYSGAMNGVIARGGWEPALASLEAADVGVLLADGALDPVPVAGRAQQLAWRHGNVSTLVHSSAGHQLPIAQPCWCVSLLAAAGDDDHDAAGTAP